jgi:hypothetical protein
MTERIFGSELLCDGRITLLNKETVRRPTFSKLTPA